MSDADDRTPVSSPDEAAPDPRPSRRRRDWRWWVGGLGKTLITTGLLMFGFVAYQLWGTGIETARAQNALEGEFADLLATTVPATTTAPTTTVASTGPTTTDPATDPTVTVPAPPVQDLPAFEEGDAIARIEVPSIDLDWIVVAGVSTADLKKGPGHYPDTPLPGQLGNAAIAAHRTTYKEPFRHIDDIEPGDEIVMTTPAGRFVYIATGTQIVSPSDYWVVATTDWDVATLTLTSCHPPLSTRERIVVSAVLDETLSSAPPGQPVLDYGREEDPDGSAVVVRPDDPDTTATVPDGSAPDASVPAADGDSSAPPGDIDHSEIADAFSAGWFSDPAAWPHVAAWGLLLAAIAVGAKYLGRLVGRRWVGWLAAVVPFVVCLYFWYQNINRLLPPNL